MNDPFHSDGSQGAVSSGPSADRDVELDGVRYTAQEPVGAGGMGRVEAVTDVHLARRVARKTVHDAALVPRLLREARLTARLEHPSIVTVHDVGVGTDGLPYYTMQLVRGSSLGSRLHAASSWAERLPLVDAVRIAAHALAYAHEQGVVHRDIKPDNIMLGPYGEVVVVDWGVATRIGEEDLLPGVAAQAENLTRVGDVIGTPAYMPPEQARGEDLDGRADVYALGRVLQEVLGDADEVELQAIAQRATASDPDARYPSASELASDLEAWREGRRVQAHDYELNELLWHHLRRWRRPLLWGGAVAVFVLGLVSAGVVRILAEEARAERAEGEARELLVSALSEQAERALRDGDLGAARGWAAEALEMGDDPVAQMVFAGVPRSPRSVAVLDAECTRGEFLEQDGLVQCSDPVRRVLDAEGALVHELESGQATLYRRPSGALVVREGVYLYDATTGEAVSDERFAGRFTAPIAGIDLAMLDTHTVEFMTPDGTITHASCGPSSVVLDAAPVGEGWVAVCSTGELLWGKEAVVLDQEHVLPERLSAVVALGPRDLVLGTLDGAVVRWRDGEVLLRAGMPPIGPIERLRLSPDGQWLVVVGAVAPVLVFRADDLAPVASLNVRDAAFSPAGELLTLGDAGLQRVDFPQEPTWVWAPHGVGAVAWGPAGDAWYGTGAGQVGHWSDSSSDYEQVGDVVVKDLMLHDGALWAALSTGPTLRLGDAWERVSGTGARMLAPLPDKGIVAASYGGVRFTLRDGEYHATLGDSVAVVASTDGTRRLEQFSAGDVRCTDALGDVAWAEGRGVLAIAPSGGWGAVVDGEQLLLREGCRGPSRSWTVDGDVTALSLSDELVAIGYLDGTVAVRQLASGSLLGRARAHRERVSSLELAGEALLSGGWDRRVQRWDLGQLRGR